MDIEYRTIMKKYISFMQSFALVYFSVWKYSKFAINICYYFIIIQILVYGKEILEAMCKEIT